MVYLSVEKLSKSFPEQELFTDLTFTIQKGDKIALIASNGAGKSTLLKILGGVEQPDQGDMYIKEDLRVGFLDQDPTFESGLTIDQLIHKLHAHVHEAIASYEKALAQQSEDFSVESQKALEEASFRMDMLNAYDYDRTLKSYLTRFKIDDLQLLVGSLSGGQKKRLAIALALADQPDLLILDEPTNHLDIEMIEWLENHLTQSSITLFMVTHDRYFLDSVCNLMLELHDGKLYRHQGNYAYFLEKRAERESVFDREMDKVNAALKKELEWMKRTPQARTTKAKSRIDAYYGLEEKAGGRTQKNELNLQIKLTRIGGKILELKHVNKAYDDVVIMKDFTYIFKKGDRVGIVGPNGVGKSTFLNLITGKEKQDSGKINLGETVVFGYYTQRGIHVSDDKRVIDVMKDIAEYIQLADGSKLSASQFLEFFMFPPEMQYKPVSKLSGGEKRRLYLLTVLIKNPNFLILDEPTNDLDLLTLNKLEEFLEGYGGCLVLVSHDRYFMDQLVDHLFIFEGNGKIRDYNDTYSAYRMTASSEAPTTASVMSTKEGAKSVTIDKNRPSNREKNEFRKLEREIDALEKEKGELERALTNGGLPLDEINTLSTKIGTLMTTIDHKTERWMELADKF